MSTSSNEQSVGSGRSPALVLIGIIGVALLAANLFISLKQTSWEYTVTAPSDQALDKELEHLGSAGWEIVFARRATSSVGESARYEMVLKRRKAFGISADEQPSSFSGVSAFTPKSTTTSSSPIPPRFLSSNPTKPPPKSTTASSSPIPATAYPSPNSPAAKITLRACIDGTVQALEGTKWVVFKIGGSTLPCTVEK